MLGGLHVSDMTAGPGRDPASGPVYQTIKATLRQEVAAGLYRPGMPFITERALCERFGVSSTTAVRVLNDLAAEGLLVRRRGLGTFVAEVSAKPAPPAATSSVTPMITCILHESSATYVSEVLHGAQAVCGELGYQVVLVDTGGNAEREEEALRTALTTGAAGILLYPVDGRPHPELFGEIRRRRLPLVLMDRYRPDTVTDAVVVDNIEAGYRVTRELIGLGHRHIATLWSETDCTSVHDRLTGYLMALRESGLRPPPEFTALQQYWPGTEEHRQAHLKRLLDMPEPPTALLCAHGYVLTAAAHDLVLLGVEIPGHIDLASMDTAGPYDILPLAAVSAALPAQELGREAARLLCNRITGQGSSDAAKHIVLPVEIRTRASSPVRLRPVRAEPAG